ncbi:MAG TPA: alpha/beta hydrolase [Gemmatimonadales bacterium]
MRHAYLLVLLAACGGGAPPPPTPAAPTGPARPTVVTLRAMRVNGTVLYFRLVGDSGTPVVFVHGSLGDYRDWNAQVPAFALTHRVLAYSRRYHPPNPQQNDDETYSPMLHADDLAALLLALELPPAHIIGSSYGAYTALVLAQEHPELVRSVVLEEPPIMPLLTLTQEGDALRRAFYTTVLDPARSAFARGDSVAAIRAFMDGSSGTPGRFDALSPAARTDALAHAFEMRREMLANRDAHFPPIPCVDLGRLHTPVLLLTGERSTRLFRLITEELGRCLTTDTTIVIPGAGHVVHAANPGYYNGIVLRYLSTH